jgi:hypothetical protein
MSLNYYIKIISYRYLSAGCFSNLCRNIPRVDAIVQYYNYSNNVQRAVYCKLRTYSLPDKVKGEVVEEGSMQNNEGQEYHWITIKYFKGFVQRILTGVNTKLKKSVLVNWRPSNFSS